MNQFKKFSLRIFFIVLVTFTGFLPNRLFVYAQNPVDDLIIDNISSYPELTEYFRLLFNQKALFWTEQDLRALGSITIEDSLGDPHMKGYYQWKKIYDSSGQFKSWIGSIHISASGDPEVALVHEYGHHFTSYWAATRTNDTFANHWPANEAGDYYQLRPLPDGCYCEMDICPYEWYHQDIWEILAEDFRTTVSSSPFADVPHFTVGELCINGTLTFPAANPDNVAAYLRALPISSTLPPTATPTPTLTPTSTPTPTLTPTPSPTPRPTIPCPTNPPGINSLQLGIGPPCYAD